MNDNDFFRAGGPFAIVFVHDAECGADTEIIPGKLAAGWIIAVVKQTQPFEDFNIMLGGDIMGRAVVHGIHDEPGKGFDQFAFEAMGRHALDDLERFIGGEPMVAIGPDRGHGFVTIDH